MSVSSCFSSVAACRIHPIRDHDHCRARIGMARDILNSAMRGLRSIQQTWKRTCPIWKNFAVKPVPGWRPTVRRRCGGLDPEQTKIVRQEMAALGVRQPLVSFGISMLGPALLKYGTDAQKKEHLPKIAAGLIRWCQGYSEPNAGSDLASLQTRAESDGDDFIINGQKIWTSYANYADWIFCLVRTDASAKKHDGISFILFDMASKGVSTKPILLISGRSAFCETFFDN